MKKNFILILLLSLKSFGQDEHSFSIDNSQLSWQKVFQNDMKIDEIESKLKQMGLFKNLVFNKNQVSGEIENIPADYNGIGKNSWNTSFYVQNTLITGTFFIEFKEGRYRITLNGINLITINELAGSGITVMSANSIQPLSEFAIKKGKFRKGFLKSDANIYEYTFSNLFDFSKYNIKSNDW